MSDIRQIRIGKLTLNIGTGKEQDKLEKGLKLLRNMTGRVPVKTKSKKRIPNWGLRLGLPIGCMVTVRKAAAMELLGRLVSGRDNRLKESNFDDFGNIAFGIPEYIDIPGVKYDPEIGVMGLQATVTLERAGYRVKRRAAMSRRLPVRHRITRQEAVEFMKSNFDVGVGEVE
ncbi:50S ribosomal protein L5 [Candidatus Woesearchaeota archaeon]|nr:50S ribosomal protein L5 [Candidatus Woesearchaeota archaeon]